MPELPRIREERLIADHGFARQVAAELTAERATADYFEALLAAGAAPKLAANWTREEALRLAAVQHKPVEAAAPVAKMAELIALVADGKVARVVAKGECDELFAREEAPTAYFEQRGMIQETDSGQLAEWVSAVIKDDANAKVIADIQGGKTSAVGRLVGCTMKLSGGKADPKAVKVEICSQLGVDA